MLRVAPIVKPLRAMTLFALAFKVLQKQVANCSTPGYPKSTQKKNFDDLSAANLDIWVTDNGLPVKLVSHIAGHSKLQVTIDANFDVTDVNSKITIAKPVP